MGYEVNVREQALGTSQWIVDHQPDYVLLDVMMPALSGAKLAHFLHQRGIPAHVILHSSRQSDELEKIAARIGAIGYITKGGDDNEFASEFERIVDTRAW